MNGDEAVASVSCLSKVTVSTFGSNLSTATNSISGDTVRVPSANKAGSRLCFALFLTIQLCKYRSLQPHQLDAIYSAIRNFETSSKEVKDTEDIDTRTSQEKELQHMILVMKIR